MQETKNVSEIKIKNRCEITINSVDAILAFDEEYVLLDSGDGRVSVEGQRLKIDSFDKEKREVTILGEISGVFYSEKKSRGLFGGWRG